MGQLVTIDGAKKKWCKSGRLPVHTALDKETGVSVSMCSVNRKGSIGDVPATKCLANDCMAWDWWDEEVVGKARRGYCSADGVKPNRIGNEKKESMGYG